jgi:hypothetical protein
VEVFKSMNVEEVPSENGDPAHEVLHLGWLLAQFVCWIGFYLLIIPLNS